MGRIGGRFEPVLDRYSYTIPSEYLSSHDPRSQASADKSIKLWHEHKQVRTYTGHTDAVRGLALVPDIGFASCANDRWVSCDSPLLVLSTYPFKVRSGSGRQKAILCIHCAAIRRSSIPYLFSPLAR